MRHLLIIPIILLAILSAGASSVELPVTPNTLNRYDYTFTVSAEATNAATAFHITITPKKEDIDSDSKADLAIVTHVNSTEAAPTETTITAFTPPTPITLTKDKRVWTADFVISRESLKTHGLCFIFSELAHQTVNGKRITMPSVTFYEIKLADFVKE
ncbi:MAG TPA: hypothetical protein VHC44_07090 [Verrucomicrobiae bacterium]|nr:hypothetical protein [Verrucomicrobiae bacterium]